MSNRHVRVVDVSSVLYTGLTGNIGKFNYKGIPTGGLYQLGMTIAQSMKFNHFLILVWDSRTNRRELYPQYKGNRSLNPKIEFWKSVSWRFLSNVVSNSFKVEGFEADDLAAEILDDYTKDMSYELVTSDYDWAYNIKDERYSLEPVNTNLPIITKDNFTALLSAPNEIPISFNTICFYKCLFGDKSDHIDRFCCKKFSLEVIYNLFTQYCIDKSKNPRIKSTVISFLALYKNLFTEDEYNEFNKRVEVIYPRKQKDFGNEPLVLKEHEINYKDFQVFGSLIGSKKILRAIDEPFIEDMGNIHESLKAEWEGFNNSYINQTHIFQDNNDIPITDKGGFIVK